MSTSKKVIIIGAGVGGLATAILLARKGYWVEVIEQNAQPGGRMGQAVIDGFTFDTGPSWYLMPEVFERYFHAIGETIADHLDIVRLSPSYKVFFEHDAPLRITGDLARDAATFAAIEPGANERVRAYAAQAKKLYQLSLRYFLYTDFSRIGDVLKPGIILRAPALVRFLTTSIHTYVAGFVKDRRLQQLLEYPMVFLGTSPFEAPALYSLISALDFESGVFYPRGGMYTIVESLVRIGTQAGVTYRYDSPVTAITIVDDRANGVALANGTTLDADIVISNADLHFTETVLVPLANRSFPETYWAKRQPSCSALLVYMGVRGSLPELEHHNLFFVDAWRENFDALYHSKVAPESASLYLSRTSATDPGVAPAGHETLFMLVPLPSGTEASGNTEALADHYIAQVEAMAGVSLADRIVSRTIFTPSDFGSVFNAWQNSMLGPSHLTRQSAFWRTPNRSRRVRNLYYVGAGTTPGVGVPMCLISAENVVNRIVREDRA